jgi:hypothetical protein
MPPAPPYRCWRARLCEWKVVRNKNRNLCEVRAERGKSEIGENQQAEICLSGFYLAGSRIRQPIRSRLRRLQRGSRIQDPGSSPNAVRNSGGQAGNSNGPWPGVFGAPPILDPPLACAPGHKNWVVLLCLRTFLYFCSCSGPDPGWLVLWGGWLARSPVPRTGRKRAKTTRKRPKS